LANAHVELDGENLTLEQYEQLSNSVPEESMELVSEFSMENSSGPGLGDLYMLNFIQGQRIYDMLALLLVKMGHVAAVEEMMNIHASGRFKAPLPELDNGEPSNENTPGSNTGNLDTVTGFNNE
jgi:hypothetical protein